MRYLVLFLLILGVGVQARELTLSDAFALAQQHAHSLRKSRAQRGAAEAALKSAKADRLPTMSVTAGGSYVGYVPRLDIDVPPILELTREMGTEEIYQADMRLTLPLFAGGLISGNIDLAEATREYYDALEKADLERLYYQTRLEYLALYRSNVSLEVSHATLRRAQVIADDTQSLFAAGAADSIDLLEARLSLSNASFAVTRAESDRRSKEIQLGVLLGLPFGEPVTLITPLEGPDMTEHTADVPPSMPELLASEAVVASSRSRVRLARAEYFPSLSAFAGYSYGKPNLDRFNNTWHGYFTIGATATWSFNVSHKAGDNVTAARRGLEASVEERDDVRRRLGREAALAVEQLRLARERHQIALEESQIANDNYRLAKDKHAHGSLSTNRLLQIETSLTQAQAALAVALVDYHIALSHYYFVTGSAKLKEGA